MENEMSGKIKIIIIGAVAVLILGCVFCAATRFGWFAAGNGRGDGIRSDRKPISEVKQQLNGAETNQRELQKTADAIEGTVGNIRQEVSGAREEVGRAEQSLSDAENQSQRATELIDECQSILSGARKRTQLRKEAH